MRLLAAHNKMKITAWSKQFLSLPLPPTLGALFLILLLYKQVLQRLSLENLFSCCDFSRGANLAGASTLISPAYMPFVAHPDSLNSVLTAGFVSGCFVPSHPPLPLAFTTGSEILAYIFF